MPAVFARPPATGASDQFTNGGRKGTTTKERKQVGRQMREMPETVAAGDAIEVQICPVGDFPNTRDGRTVMQRCDAAALKAVAAAFGEPVLVDFDHSSDEGGSTPFTFYKRKRRGR